MKSCAFELVDCILGRVDGAIHREEVDKLYEKLN